MKKNLIVFTVIMLISLSLFADSHFLKVWSGHGYQQMNFYFTEILVNDTPLTIGDEIAVFDQKYCVGMLKLTENTSFPYNVIASNNDGMAGAGTQNGFVSGRPVIFKVYKVALNTEYTFSSNEVTHLSGNQNFAVLGSASFSLDGEYNLNDVYALTLQAVPEAGGILKNSANFVSGKPVTINALRNVGYVFNNWKHNETVISTNAMHEITMPAEARTYTANFTAASHQVTVSPNNVSYGSVAGSGTYGVGAVVTVNANANPGYALAHWTRNGTPVSTNPQYSFVMPNQAQTLIAHFEVDVPVLYSLTTNVNPVSSGIVTGAGEYQAGQSVTVSATPAVGYSFVNWTRQGVPMSTSPNYTFTMPSSNTELVANFQSTAPNEYNLSLSVTPQNSGTVSGGGAFPVGQSVTVTATANLNYSFVNWTKNGQVVSSSSNYTFNMPAEHTNLIANFSQNYRNLSLSVLPANSGNVTGAGSYGAGDPVTVTATPNTGYAFLNWTRAGTVLSENASYSFNMPDSNTNLVANFISNQSQVSITVNPVNSGSVTGAGNYVHGASVTVTATPNQNYNFVSWTISGVVQSTQASYTFVMPVGNVNLVANFATGESALNITVNPVNSGTVTGSGTYAHGANVTVTATPNQNYSFLNWTKGSVVQSTQPTYTFTMPAESVNLIANFEELPPTLYTVSANVNPVNSGTISGTGQYEAGQSVTLTVTPSQNYNFLNWTKNGVVQSTQAIYTFTMPAESVALQANLSLSQYSLSLQVNPAGAGTVSGAGSYIAGHEVILNATANSGYLFAGWKRGDTLLSTNSVYTYTMPSENVTLTAHFTALEYTLSILAVPANSGTFTGQGTYTVNSAVSLSAVPNTGYQFDSWKIDNQVISNNPQYTYIMPASNVNITAHFSLKTYSLGLNTSPSNTGQLFGAGQYTMGAEVTVSVVPNPGFEFLNWKNGNTEISSTAEFIFTMPAENVSLTAFLSALSYNLSLSTNPVNAGTTAGHGSYTAGTEVFVSVSPAQGYSFQSWTNGEMLISNQPGFEFIMPVGDIHLTANFNVINYDLSINVTPVNGGTVIGAGSFPGGTTVPLTATPALGYQFLNWKNGDTILSTSANYTYSMPYNNVTLSANFEPVLYPLTISVNPSGAGIVSGAGNYTGGTQVSLSAIPAINHTFANWSVDNEVISTNPNYTYMMPYSAINIVANFNVDEFTVSLSANPSEGGSVSGAGSYAVGQVVNISATPAEGYRFIDWKRQGVTVSANADYNFFMPAQNQVIVAHFELIPPTLYAVSLNALPSEGGTVTGSGTYTEGETVIINAQSNPDYRFLNWKRNNQIVSEEPEYSFEMPASNLTFNASFALNQYTVSVQRVPANGGSVSGAGVYIAGRNVTLQANPATNYQFVNWTNAQGEELSTNEIFSFVMPEQNVQCFANFALDQYNVIASVIPQNSGAVTGTGLHGVGTQVTLNAFPAENYHFVSWTNLSGVVVSNSSEFTFFMPNSNITYFANFALDQYSVTLNRNIPTGGTVSGSGNYAVGASVTITANPAVNYHFVSWTNTQGEVVSTESTYLFTMPASNLTYRANFALDQYNLSLNINPVNGGIVSGAGSYNVGSNVSITASPSLNYHFVNWTNAQGDVLSTESTYSFTMPANNISYTANFTLDQYNLSLNINPVNSGTVSGAGSYDVGSVVSITANPSLNYHFVSWTNAQGEVISTESTYAFTMPANNINYTANFALDQYNVTLGVNPENSGTVTGAGTYDFGASVNLVASPAENYHFVNWTNAQGEIISTESFYTFTMPANNINYTANFALDQYNVTLVVNPGNSGTVTGSGVYDFGASVNLVASPAENYHFVNWTNAQGITVSTESSYTFTMPANDINYTANFAIDQYSVFLLVNPENSGTVTGSGVYDFGAVVNLIATPAENYHFVNWTNAQGEFISTESTYAFTMPANDINYTANFALNQYNVSVNIAPENSGTVTGAGAYDFGASVNLIALPAENYHFVNWTDSQGIVVGEDEIYSFIMTDEDVTITANFALDQYNVTYSILPPGAGSVSGSGIYEVGSEVSLTAQANDLYMFVSWTDAAGITLSEESVYSFIMPSNNVQLNANFALIPVFNPPLNLNAVPSYNYISLSWEMPESLRSNRQTLTGFKVFRDGNELSELTQNLYYQDNNVVTGTVYTYYVIAYYTNPDGESEPSESVQVSLLIPAFNPPQNLSANPGFNQITLSWDLPVPATLMTSTRRRSLSGFRVYRDNEVIAEFVTTILYVDTNLVPGTDYEYFVTAVYTDPSGESEPSNSVTAQAILPVFNPPQNLTAIAGNNQVVLNWEMPLDRALAGFRVFKNEVNISGLITELNFTDSNVSAGNVYEYYVTAVYTDPAGESDPSNIVVVDNVSESDNALIPTQTLLYTNYPNPFNPETVISFSLNKDSYAQVRIFNAKGQLVKILCDEYLNAGYVSVVWNGKDSAGRNVASGIYLYQLQTEEYVSTRKMILMK